MIFASVIDPEVRLAAPGFRAISLVVEGSKIVGRGDRSFLSGACELVQAGGPDWREAHLVS